jgi:serine/threonine-protein kinase RsbW
VETLIRTLESRLENIDLAEEMVMQVARRAGFHAGHVARIGLSVRETCANAVIHGNRYDRRKRVCLEVSSSTQRIEIAVSDEGKGFDSRVVPDPTEGEALTLPSGRGLFLAKMFMDEFDIRPGLLCGAKVVMVKHLAETRERLSAITHLAEWRLTRQGMPAVQRLTSPLSKQGCPRGSLQL